MHFLLVLPSCLPSIMVNFVHLHFAQNKIVTSIWIVNNEIAEKPFSDRQMVHLV